MGDYHVDATSKPGILQFQMKGTFSVPDMEAFVREHNAAVDSFGVAAYRVFADLRELKPLSPDCAALMEKAKQYSDAKPNFRGSAVWVSTLIVAMQHKRTSQTAGVISTELISEKEEELWAHLQTVNRVK